MFVLLPIGFAAYYSLFRWNGVGWPHDFLAQPGVRENLAGGTNVVTE